MNGLLWALVLLGGLLRVHLTAAKPLWHDEIFTLTLARESVRSILTTLHIDSGPPLHYVVSHVLLLPFREPGPGDHVVRALSLLAAFLHVPLFFRVARRLGRPELGLPAAAVFALSPLAADYAAEGRGYALASLFVLLALERALELRARPRAAVAVQLGLAAAAAALTHYLAVFPLAGLAWLLRGATPPARRQLLLGALCAAAAAAPWLPVALAQPRSSLEWAHEMPRVEASERFLANLAFWGEPPGVTGARVLGAAGLLALAAVLALARRRAPLVIGSFATGLVALAGGVLAASSILLPERTALPFLPLVALAFAAAPRAVTGPAACVALVLWAPLLARATRPSPGQDLASVVAPLARRAGPVCAAGLWGLELDYRLRRAGLPDPVVFFPSDVRAHRGWYKDAPSETARYEREARELVESGAARLFVLPHGLAASAALASELSRAGARPVAANRMLQVVVLPAR